MKFTLKNETGIHARPASLIVAESKKYEAKINFIKDGNPYNAKSIMSLMSMEARCGDTIELQIEGADAPEAQKGILAVLESL